MNNLQAVADGHRRIRRDHAAETAEDYVRAIQRIEHARGRCRVTDLAREFAVSHVTVTKIIARLKRELLVTSERYGPVTLTARGRQLAAKSQRQHSIVYEFLRAIGVDEVTAAIDAEGIEHHVSRQTLDCLRRLQCVVEANGPRVGQFEDLEEKTNAVPAKPSLRIEKRDHVA